MIESFKLLKEIYKVDQKTFDRHMDMFNEPVGLKSLYPQQVRTLSLGQRMLCDITASFLHNPQVVFLDEPIIVQGTFLKYYFRPLNMMFYHMSEMFDLKGLTQMVVGIALLIYASIQLNLDWTPLRFLLLLITLFSAALVQISIIVAASCAAFWVLDSYPVLGLAWKLREFSPYPMSIFDGAFRFAFTYVIPIGFVAFYLSQLLLRPDGVSPLIHFSPLVGIALFAITYWSWTKGVNSYTGTGS